MIELLKKISPYIALFMGIITPFVNRFWDKKQRKLQYMKDFYEVGNNTSHNFQKHFVNQRYEELLFFIESGIKTKHQYIQSYIDLYQSIGERYDWEIIKNAKPHFKFDEDKKIYIELTKCEKFHFNIVTIVATLFVLIMFVLILYTIQLESDKKVFLIVFFFELIMFGLTYFIVYSIKSINAAKNIIKSLEGNHNKIKI